MYKRYPSDLTDGQWNLIAYLIPLEKPGGAPRKTDMREVVNALYYMSRTGCQWRMLPNDFPPRSTIYGYFKRWSDDGVIDEMVRVLRENIRIKAGRGIEPTATIIDSQTVKTAGANCEVGYDGHKKIKGRKRHIAVDVLGLLLSVLVHSASIQDRSGARLLVSKLMEHFTRLKIVFADGGYTGNHLKDWFQAVAGIILEIVKRPRGVFQVVKFRWVVERTFGWMNTQRRLSKDYEYSPQSSEAWVKIASINTMLHRLSPG